MSEKVIKLKQALEKENLEFFLKMYNSNFPIIENFFDKNFSLKNNIIKDTYLSFIHREREQNFPIFRTLRKYLISSNLFCFLQSIHAALIKNFTYIETMKVKDKNQTNYLFINRGQHYFYDDIISQVKNSNGNVSYTNDSELSMINKLVKFKFNRKLVKYCIADFRSTYKVIRQLNKEQRFYFIKLLYKVILFKRLYKSKSNFDYLIDSKDNTYLPFQKSLANLYCIKIILIQNGGRVDLSQYGYIRCDFFLGWNSSFFKFVVGDIDCDNFFSIGSSSLSREIEESTIKEYEQRFSNYDLLIIEQMTTGLSQVANYLNHKIFLDKILRFRSNNPDVAIGYLFRYDRKKIPSKLKQLIKDNDKSLELNSIDKIDRKFCSLAIKKSRVSIAIDSSVRIESFMIEKIGFTLQPSKPIFDWLSILMPEKVCLFSDLQTKFEAKLSDSINLTKKDSDGIFHQNNTIKDLADVLIK